MPTLAELRGQKGKAPRPRSTHTVTLVTGQHLLDEQKRLNDELLDVMAQASKQPATEEEAEAAERVRKAGQRAIPPRAEQIRAETAALYDRLGEHQGQVTLVGTLSDGDWLRWKENHPPRDDNADDERVGHGLVNTADLYDDLGLFVAEWDGEPVADGDWSAWLADQITYADKAYLVTEVIALYETRLSRAPKSPSTSSETPPGSND